MEITYNVSPNFLGDTIKYSADLYNELKGHEARFHGLNEMHVELTELSYHKIAHDKTKEINFSKDNKRLELRLTFHRYYDQNMKVTGTPSPFDVYQHIRLMLNKAAIEYAAFEN